MPPLCCIEPSHCHGAGLRMRTGRVDPSGRWPDPLDHGQWAIRVSLNSKMGQWSRALLTHRLRWVGPGAAPRLRPVDTTAANLRLTHRRPLPLPNRRGDETVRPDGKTPAGTFSLFMTRQGVFQVQPPPLLLAQHSFPEIFCSANGGESEVVTLRAWCHCCFPES